MSADHATPLWRNDEVTVRRRVLLGWYDAQGRDLPWRRQPGLYGTWISEIMLQQTTVAAVLPRWSAFLERFPDVASLAAADQDEVLSLWSGLGYYRRARSLHEAARQVMAAGGALPHDRKGWRALPGVGDYAAGAIASIGLGQPEVAIDANVRRVLTRWACSDGRSAAALRPAQLRRLAAEHLDPHRPGDWNQALMDLGAGPCQADSVQCGECPVRSWCAAGQAGTAGDVPPPPKRREPVLVTVGLLVVRRRDQILVQDPRRAMVTTVAAPPAAVVRRQLGTLLAGTLCLPMTPWFEGHRVSPEQLLDVWSDRWPPLVARHLGHFGHTITHHRLRVHVALAGGTLPALDGPWRLQTGDWPRSTLVNRALALIPDS